MKVVITGTGQINEWISNSLEALYECNFTNIITNKILNTLAAELNEENLSLKFIRQNDNFVNIEIESTSDIVISLYKETISKIFSIESERKTTTKETSTKISTIPNGTENKSSNQTVSTIKKKMHTEKSNSIAVVLCVLVLAFALVLLINFFLAEYTRSRSTLNLKSSQTSVATSAIPSSTAEQSVTPTPEPTPSKTYYKAGTYKVGTDLPAGDYFIIGPGYVEVSADSSGDSIIDNENLDVCSYVRVNDGEYLKLSRCKIIPEAESTPLEVSSYLDGTFKVGKDIPAGEYKITANGSSGYYERNAAPIGTSDDIIANDNFQGSTYITINDGEYLKLSNCTLIK